MKRVVVLAGCAAFALVLGAPGSGSPLAPRQIKLVRSAPEPKELRVGLGAKVDFVNKDRRPHKVKSVRNAWPLITLLPGAKATVQLYAAGRYEYKVDGRKKGVILVGRVIAGYTPGPGSAQVEEDVRYSIRVEASVHSKTVWSTGFPGTSGIVDSTMRWVGTWPSAQLHFIRVGSSIAFLTRPEAIGAIRFESMEFSDSRPSSPACSTKVDYPPLRAEAILRGGASFTAFDAHTVGSGNAALHDLMEAARGSCSTVDFPVWLEEPDPTSLEGVSVDPPRSGIGADDSRFLRQGRGYPLNRILAHQGFTVDTGPRSVAPRSCGDECTESFQGRVRFVFKALRPR
jgi:hypothetical protein